MRAGSRGANVGLCDSAPFSREQKGAAFCATFCSCFCSHLAGALVPPLASPGAEPEGDWGFFLYKKGSISIQDIIIYHLISCRYHDISLCIISSIMIYHVPRRIMIYRDIIFFPPPCDIMSISCHVLDDTWT